MQNFAKNSAPFLLLIIKIILIIFKNCHCGTLSPPILSSTTFVNCYDQGQDCTYRWQLCDNSLYFNLMSWQCPWTCNRCPPDGNVPTRPPQILDPPLLNRNCKDFLDCPTWARNGFCSVYSTSTRAAFCPITCQVGCAIGGGGGLVSPSSFNG